MKYFIYEYQSPNTEYFCWSRDIPSPDTCFWVSALKTSVSTKSKCSTPIWERSVMLHILSFPRYYGNGTWGEGISHYRKLQMMCERF